MNSSNTYQEQNISNTKVESNSSKSDLVQKIKKSLYKQERDLLWRVVKQIRQSTGKNEFVKNTVKTIQQELGNGLSLLDRLTKWGKISPLTNALLGLKGRQPNFLSVNPFHCFQI